MVVPKSMQTRVPKKLQRNVHPIFMQHGFYEKYLGMHLVLFSLPLFAYF